MILVLLACATPSADTAPTPDVAAPAIADCPAGLMAEIPLSGPVYAATVATPSGAVVAPFLRILADRVAVNCPEEGGVLTIEIEWGGE